MNYIAAYALVASNNAQELSAQELKSKMISLFASIDAPYSEESLDLLISKVSGKSLNELIQSGSELMKTQLAAAAPAASNNNSGNATARSAQIVEESESSESEALDLF